MSKDMVVAVSGGFDPLHVGHIRYLKEAKSNSNNHVKVVTSEEEIVELAKLGYDCQPIGDNKWSMKEAT